MEETDPTIGQKVDMLDLTIRRIELKPGDIGVIMCPFRLTAEQRARIIATYEELLPGHKFLVLQEGMTLGIVGREIPGD